MRLTSNSTLRAVFLCVLLLGAALGLHAQSGFGDNALRSAYADPGVQAAIQFIRERLPQISETNRPEAIQEFLEQRKSLQKLDKSTASFLEGQVYAELTDVQQALPYFRSLATDPAIGAEASRMLDLLLFYQAAVMIHQGDAQATQGFLEDAITNYPIGKHYPTFLYLLLDVLAENGDFTKVELYRNRYAAYRDWMQDTFKPRKEAILARLAALDLNRFFQNPTDPEYQTLERSISAIQTDLAELYEEFKTKSLYLDPASLDSISTRENKILEDFKQQLKYYSYIPPLDFQILAVEEPIQTSWTEVEIQSFNIYKNEAAKLIEAKDYSQKLTGKLAQVDDYLEERYQLYLQEDPSVLGTGFSDMELKRLIEIQKNIDLYTEVLQSIDALMGEPGYATLNIDLEPQRREYEEKLADLQIRTERYQAFCKHQNKAEEEMFTAAWDDYRNLSQIKMEFARELPATEEGMREVITEKYFSEKQKVIVKQQSDATQVTLDNPTLSGNLAFVITNLDFLDLQIDYRRLHYLDQQRQAQSAQISENELVKPFEEILADKASLLKRYQDFLALNPDFQSLEQPGGAYLLSAADLYYNMAELQYAIDLDHPEKALAYYRLVLETAPEYHLRDYVLYNIGYIGSEYQRNLIDNRLNKARETDPRLPRTDSVYKYHAEDFQESLAAFRELTQEARWQDSPLYDEALYRLGVLYFILGLDATDPIVYYDEARRLFGLLANSPDSKYHYEAIYQRGWLNMNQSDEPSLNEAVDDFVFLIEAVDGKLIQDQSVADDYKSSSVENIGICLATLDGSEFKAPAKGIARFNTAMGDYPHLEIKTRILDKAAQIKAEMPAPLQAIDFLELRLALSPLDLQNPAVLDSIITLYHTPMLEFRTETDLTRIKAEYYQRIIGLYNTGSDWQRHNLDNQDVSQPAVQKQLQVIRKAFEQTRIILFNAMISTADKAAIKAYRDHMDSYRPRRELFGESYGQWIADIDRDEVGALASIAEKNGKTEDLFQAVQGLWDYDDKYPANPSYYDYEGTAYVFVDRIYEGMTASFNDSLYIPPQNLPANRDSLYQFYRDASTRFFSVLSMPEYASEKTSQTAVTVTMKLSRIQIDQGLLAEAKASFRDLLKLETSLGRNINRDIYLSLADIAQKENNLAEAEAAYRNALKYASDKKDQDAINHEIRMQIQTGIDVAERNGDFELAAREYILISNEYKVSKADKDKYVGNRDKAAQAYIRAQMYQEAINVKLGLVETADNLDQKYSLYYDCWGIADSLMQDEARVTELKNAFIALAPSSNYAYRLQNEAINALAQDPLQRIQAANQLLALHDQVRAKKINSGDVTPDSLYIRAIELYNEDQNTDQVLELMDKFIALYPKHSRVTEYLAFMANQYAARNDQERHEYYARALFLKDNKQYAIYQRIAAGKLYKIVTEFYAAYKQQDWKLAFQKRDDYKKVEAAYKRDNLPLNTTLAYQAFTVAEQEYRELQAKNAYLAKYERQIRAVEQGSLLKSSPSDLITILPRTSWMGHLFGGVRRVPILSGMADQEYQVITDLLKQSESKYLSTSQRLRALDLICRVNDHTADAIESRIVRYLEISNEVKDYRNNNSEEQYQNQVRTLMNAEGYIAKHRSISSGIYRDIYDSYTLAGYSDQFTIRAESVLQARNLLPDYRVDYYPLNSDWRLSSSQAQSDSASVDRVSAPVVTTLGYSLGSYTIPAQDTLIVEREFTGRVAPSYMFMHLAYVNNPTVFINNVRIEPVYLPVDSLAHNGKYARRYAARLTGKPWKETANTLKVVFHNPTPDPVPLDFSASVVFDNEKIAAKLPSETVVYPTSNTWLSVAVNPLTGKTERNPAIFATDFNLPVNKTKELANSTAEAIWVPESVDAPRNNVILEYDFTLETQFRSGYVDFVAPETVSVYLNGQLLIDNYGYEYDMEPEFVVYPKRVSLPAEHMLKGKNTLRLEVQNSSPYRGLLAEVSLTRAVKE